MGISAKRIIIYLFVSLVSIFLFIVMSLTENKFVEWAWRKDIVSFLNLFVMWNTFKLFFLGLVIGVISIPFSFILIRILYLELYVEKALGRKIYALNVNPSITIWNLFKHGYFLFAPIIILTKIFSTILSTDILSLYLLIGEIIRDNIWIVYLILTLPYIILDYSRIRSFNKKSLSLEPPSKLLDLIAILLLGAGSIASAVPIFYDIVGLFKDIQLSAILFVYAIALFYLPALSLVTATYIVFFKIGKKEYKEILESLNKRVIEGFGALKIEEETTNVEAQKS